MIPKDCKRLAEVDFPVADVSRHAAREKSIRKGLPSTLLLARDERRVTEDRRDCFWLYVVTNCSTEPQLQEPIRDPARLDWTELTKVAHFDLSVDARQKPMQVREDSSPYGDTR